MKKFINIFLTTLLLLLSSSSLSGIPPVSADGKAVSLAPMLDIVTPTVVNISVATSSPMADNPLFTDPFFRQFFNIPDLPPEQSAGSGVIIDASRGIIITNHHVISRAQEIKVTLKDRRVFTAKLIGIDPQTDIAVISIPPQNLKAIKLGDSDEVLVGDFVAAIGNPFAIGQTVTSGIVSALGRSGLNVRNFEDFIQTDAAINPGNSGGALVNLSGELIGINSNIISPAGSSSGIGFAIPVNMVKTVANQIIENGRVMRGAFGVEIQDLNPKLAESFNIKQTQGAIVTKLQNGSAAVVSGLAVGDIITEINGKPVISANHLRSQLGLIPQNKGFTLKIFRSGKTQIINATMGGNSARLPNSRSGNSRGAPSTPNSKNALINEKSLGIKFSDSDNGVVISEIDEKSIANSWGLNVGDIILAIDNQEIKTTSDIPPLSPNQINIAIQRGNSILRIIRR